MSDINHKIITLSDGQQVVVQEQNLKLSSVETGEASIVDEQPVDITEQQFNDIVEQGNENPEKAATMIQNISVIPMPEPDNTNTPQEETS